MRYKQLLSGILLMIILLLVPVVAAGGWVVITLDSLPGPIHAGETARLGFMVRQHGERPINDVTPLLQATNQETGETVQAEATQVGETGHFEVAVAFPVEGVWEWSLSAPPFPQETVFAPLTVLPAAPVETGGGGLDAGVVRAALRWAGLALVAAAGLLLLRERRHEPLPGPGRQEAARP